MKKTNLHLRLIFLINNIKKNRINGQVTIHVDLKLVVPPQNPCRTDNIHSGVQHHLPPRRVGNKASGVVGHLEAVEASWKEDLLGGLGGLRACLDLGGTEEGALVEDGHGGGGVVDGGDVGVGDLDGEDELGVEEWEVELEGGQLDGHDVEGGVLWLGRYYCCCGYGGRRPDESLVPAPFHLQVHLLLGLLGVQTDRVAAGVGVEMS
ncbi:hypothetical protein FF1_006721 [Malus domestica]